MDATAIAESKEGILYCIWNEMYQYYGNSIYKCGQCIKMDGRLLNYCTPYLKPCTVLYASPTLRNKVLAENILFIKLKQFRVSSAREFFDCDIDIIKKEIDVVVALFDKYNDEELYDLFLKNTRQLKCTTKQNIINAVDITPDDYDALLEKEMLTSDEQYSIEKYNYSNKFNVTSDEINTQFMDTYYGKLHIEENMNKFIKILDNELMDDGSDEFKKMNYLKEVLNELGFSKIDDKVPKADFENGIPTIKDVVDVQFKKIFGVKQEDMDEMWTIKKTNKKILGFLNRGLSEYGVGIVTIQKEIYIKEFKKKTKKMEYLLRNIVLKNKRNDVETIP